MADHTQPCQVSEAELLRYEDGDLPPERQTFIAAHLATCQLCQERLAASATIGRLLRTALRPIDDPAGEAELLAQLRQRQGQGQPRHRRVTHGLLSNPAVIALGLLIVVLTGIAVQSTTTADFRLGRVVAFVTQSEPATRPEARPPVGHPLTTTTAATPAALDVMAVAPPVLPRGLSLVEFITDGHERVVLRYRDGTGLELRVGQERAKPSMTVVGTGQTERLVVQQTEVIVERNTLGDIVRIVWERAGVFFDLLVLQPGAQPLTTADAAAIAETLLAAQDALP